MNGTTAWICVVFCKAFKHAHSMLCICSGTFKTIRSKVQLIYCVLAQDLLLPMYACAFIMQVVRQPVVGFFHFNVGLDTILIATFQLSRPSTEADNKSKNKSKL